ncbi:MAG: nitrogenase molybdenum-iron protein [Lachnospiraceae bacterium]|nr:nitrogenase molybdenum-iron protein [Lachnospiraceae bacterium]
MGIKQFFEALYETARSGRKDLYGSLVQLGEQEDAGALVRRIGTGTGAGCQNSDADSTGTQNTKADLRPVSENQPPKGYRGVLTPFAPDQSGAVSVFYELGGITVICDAGGCTGNICGFDEPRWFRERSAVFSAGLRDMDAILGRDDRLIAKLADTAALLRDGTEKDPAFTAIVGTPVPAVIGTDFKALERMAKKKTGLPCIGIACDGMEYYDRGVEKAYLALFEKFEKIGFARKTDETEKSRDRIGILGAQYMDLSGFADFAALREEAEKMTGKQAVIFGSREDGVLSFADPQSLSEVIVVTVSGYEAAKRLAAKYGTALRFHNPLAEKKIREIVSKLPAVDKDSVSKTGVSGKKILVVYEQVTANSCREALLELGAAKVDAASWFMMKEELRGDGDLQLREESDIAEAVRRGGYDMIIADPVMIPLVGRYFDGVFADLPHFAVSGKL